MLAESSAAAYEALDTAEEALAKLEAGCCRPERSPRMASLAGVLAAARAGIGAIDGDPHRADLVISSLEGAGAQIGSLQVSCCAPGRNALYAAILESLMRTQRAINRSLERGH